MHHPIPSTASLRLQTGVGIGVLLLALGLGLGALTIPSHAGYSGVGPNFLPWLVAVALFFCSLTLLVHVRRGGFRHMEEANGERPYWPGFVWMSAGLLANAALITSIGFILSCTLCFVMAARGLRMAEGQGVAGLKSWAKDLLIGLLIASPVYWMFTQFLAINLPGLTQSGWL